MSGLVFAELDRVGIATVPSAVRPQGHPPSKGLADYLWFISLMSPGATGGTFAVNPV